MLKLHIQCVGSVFENNPTHVLAFHRSKLYKKHVIHVFFKPFV
jgi:hypothetical protein